MTLKKSKVSNLIWIIYSVFALAFSAVIFTKASESFGYDVGFGLLAVPVALGLSIGTVFLSEFIKKKINKQLSVKPIVNKLLPYILAACFVGVGLYLRINEFNLGHYELGVYFSNSVITKEPMVHTLHGASQFYYYFLRQLLMLFGNHFEFAVIYQIVIYCAADIVLFFGIKRILGNIPALTMCAFVSLTPASISYCMKLGPSVLFLLFTAIDIVLISYTVPFRKNSYIFGGIAGALTGLIGYMDLTSVIFIIMAILFLAVDDRIYESKKADDDRPRKYVKKDKSKKKKLFNFKLPKLNVEKVAVLQDKTVALIIFFGAWITVLFICIVIDFATSGYSFSYAVKTYVAMYSPNEFSLYSMYTGVDVVSGIILAFLMLVGILAGFRRQKTDQGNFIFIIALVLCVLVGSSMIGSEMNGYYYIYIAICLLAGETVYDVTVKTDTAVALVSSKDKATLDAEANGETDKSKTVHKIEDVEMLDNPLPVPVKKARKKMEYDYFVPEDAEYDI